MTKTPAESPMVSGTRSATLSNIVPWRILLSVLALSSLGSAVEIRVAAFNIGAVFTGSAPDFSLGDPGTPDHETVKAILDRIDADIVSLEEIAEDDTTGSPSDLSALAASLGYPHVYEAPNEGSAGTYAAPFDTSLRVAILSRYPFITTGVITSPLGAREMARFHAVVKVDIPGTTNDPVVIGTHLKSGDATDDRFRRVIEMRRLTEYLSAHGITEDDNLFIVGDFNLVGANRLFETLPTGVPANYDLGDDVTFPVSYSTNPLAYFSSPGVIRLDPRQLNGSAVTFPSSGNVLDLMMVSPAIAGRMHGTEIYNSALDVSNSAGLPKAGDPLAAQTSQIASDHLALFGDFELDADLPNLALSLSLPGVLEGMPDGTVMATITLPATLAEPVSVFFSSDDPEAAVPISPVLEIPAGSLGGSVAIRTPKNYLVDPERSVTITAMAAGHDPDNAVLVVGNVDGPYRLAGPGATVSEGFDGFGGTHDPAPWTTTGSHPWRGMDDGASVLPGLRAYGPATEPALGFLPGGSGTVASASFVNDSDETISALEIAFEIEQWRAALDGTADTLSAEVFHAGVVTPLPALDYAASTTLPTGPVEEGVATPRFTTVSGLSISPGDSFELRLSFIPGSGGGAEPADVFVNEIHYDNSGTDSDEFVEIVVAPGYTGPLSAVSLVLYNGNGGTTYGVTHTLDTFTAGATTSSGYRIFSKAISGLQNELDGMAVVVNGSVLHFISYEGSFVATNGPANGMSSTDIGADQDPAPAVNVSSIGLTGTAGDASGFTWIQFPAEPQTPGQPNTGQTFIVPALPSQGIAIDNLSVTFLHAGDPDTDGDGMVNSLDPDDDNDTQADADELAFGTDPLNPSSVFRPLLSAAGDQLSFPGAAGIAYTVESSPDLQTWDELGTFAGSGQAVVVPLPAAEDSLFFRVRAGSKRRPRRLPQACLHACARRSTRSRNSSAASWVDSSTTGGALPASKASFQREAQRHQRSPGLKPGKSNSGRGVERSLPRDFEKARNSSVTWAQTTCTPTSPRPVRQQPSRKKPVIGRVEHGSSTPPSTFLRSTAITGKLTASRDSSNPALVTSEVAWRKRQTPRGTHAGSLKLRGGRGPDQPPVRGERFFGSSSSGLISRPFACLIFCWRWASSAFAAMRSMKLFPLPPAFAFSSGSGRRLLSQVCAIEKMLEVVQYRASAEAKL